MDERTILSRMPAAAMAVGADGRVGFANDAAADLLGMGLPDIVGSDWNETLLARGEGALDGLRACLEHGSSVEVEAARFRAAAGSLIQLVVRASPIVSGGGRPDGAILVLEDVTRNASLMAELEDLRAAAEISHASSMELAIGVSECFSVLSEIKKGNYDARPSAELLRSPEELMSGLARALDETIDGVREQIKMIRQQQIAIHELGTPVLQIWDGVLALPVIGVVDTRRSSEIMERLLSEIVARQSRFVILDITGVELVDTKTADHFIKVVKSSQLLGARCIITGIRPAVAQTLVDLGVDLSAITTMGTLREGLKECLRHLDDAGASGKGK